MNAIEKIKEGRKAVSGSKERVMAPAVAEALMSFCNQDAEFAQAVEQGGSFTECMKAVASGIGQSISDIDAYKKAVQFYFPGAQVRMQLTIDLIGDADKKEETAPMEREDSAIVLRLEDFL